MMSYISVTNVTGHGSNSHRLVFSMFQSAGRKLSSSTRRELFGTPALSLLSRMIPPRRVGLNIEMHRKGKQPQRFLKRDLADAQAATLRARICRVALSLECSSRFCAPSREASTAHYSAIRSPQWSTRVDAVDKQILFCSAGRSNSSPPPGNQALAPSRRDHKTAGRPLQNERSYFCNEYSTAPTSASRPRLFNRR